MLARIGPGEHRDAKAGFTPSKRPGPVPEAWRHRTLAGGGWVMKQKNLILMVVAVGCGLLAAFLTSQMSAKPQAAPPQMRVLVVAKELAPGTKFTLDSIKDQFKEKLINPEAVPEKAVFSEEMLDGKTLNKTSRVDDFLRESDLGNYQPLDPPEGKHIITVRLPIDKITPFVQPNSRVDIMGTAMTKDEKVKAAVLIPNVLVMAADVRTTPPNGNVPGDLTVQLISIAASREEAAAVRICEAANVKLSFILRSDAVKSNEEFSLDHVVNWINGEQATVKADEQKTPPPETPKEVLAKLWVPTSDLPAGTQLTDDTLANKFKEIQWQGALPANAVEKLKDHVGRFIVKDVYADQPVPKQCLADAMPKKAEPEQPKAKPADDNTAKAAPVLPEEPKKEKLATFDRTYTSPQGTKVYRYEIQKSGDLKILGEVTPDGSLIPFAAPEKKDTATPRKES
jgi:pilus assembly protein CpaB